MWKKRTVYVLMTCLILVLATVRVEACKPDDVWLYLPLVSGYRGDVVSPCVLLPYFCDVE